MLLGEIKAVAIIKSHSTVLFAAGDFVLCSSLLHVVRPIIIIIIPLGVVFYFLLRFHAKEKLEKLRLNTKKRQRVFPQTRK